MEVKSDRVVIDTNLWISFLLTSDYSKLDKIFRDESLVLLFSEELLDELLEVVSRPKFRKYFSAQDITDLLVQINNKADFVKTISIVDICRDNKDNFLLSLALDGKATHLITGDKDLLILKSFKETAIISISEYINNK